MTLYGRKKTMKKNEANNNKKQQTVRKARERKKEAANKLKWMHIFNAYTFIIQLLLL